jgi:hypothetical protein
MRDMHRYPVREVTELLQSPADISRNLLISMGLLSDPSIIDPTTNLPTGTWPGYESAEPSKPDNVVTFFNTMGTPDMRSSLGGYQWYHFGILIRVRSIDAPTGWAKASALGVTLTQQVNRNTIVVGSGSYIVHSFSTVSQPIPLGKDNPNTKRSLFTISATMTLRAV